MATSIVSPNVIEAPVATPQTDRIGWASKEDWIRNHTLIGQLYRQQSLAEVMAFMEKEHNFKATEKMYKTRIKQWHLDKKHKENEMRAIVRKNEDLGSQGKSATFRVRGQLVDFKDVVRYWERKGVRIEDVIAQRTKSKTPEGVDCFTSIPSPIMTPESIASPERILVSIQDYFRGSFENGTWVTTDPQEGCNTTKVQGRSLAVLNQLLDDLTTACALFGRNEFQEAGHSLITATSRIRSTILAEHPDTLLYIFRIIQWCLQAKRSEIALAVLRQYSALAGILMGKKHPIHVICGFLASIAPLQLETVIIRCGGSMVHHFESLAGPLNMSTLSYRLYSIASEVDTEHSRNQKLILLKDTLHKCETILGLFDVRTCQVRFHLADYYRRIMNHAEALRVGWDVVTHALHCRLEVHYHTEGLAIVASSEYAMGDIYSAEVHLREAIDSRISEHGPNDSRATHFLVELEGWLVEQGQIGSAAQVQERWKESLVDCTDFV